MNEPPSSLREMANRCLLVSMPGLREGPIQDPLRSWITEGLGGVILYSDNVRSYEQLRQLTGAVSACRLDTLIAIDEEGGDVTRLWQRHGCPYPGNLALGFLDEAETTWRVAASIGSALRQVGIGFNLAPVADVNTNPENPVIGTRSFGSDPDVVAKHVQAFVRGSQAAGVLTCVKHFPGHGDTSQDSHFGSPFVMGPIDDHLTPFRAAIDAGVDAVLSAHVVYGALDTRVATLSESIMTELLRKSLGFDGVIVTDSLTMAAIRNSVGLVDGAIQALNAGADLLCLNASATECLSVRDGIINAVRDGRLSRRILSAAADRVAALAWRQREAQSIGCGLLLDKHSGCWGDRLLTIDLERGSWARPYIVELASPRRGLDASASSLLSVARRLDEGIAGVSAHELREEGLSVPSGCQLVLVVREAHCDVTQRQAIERHPQAIVVGVGTAHDASLAPGRYIGTHGASRPNLEAAAQLLLSRVGMH